jgi:WD40 repeat protein
VTASEDATIRIWNIESGKEERALEGHRSGVLSVAMSADGKYLASAGNDFTVRIWNAGSGELLHTFANMQIVNNGFGSVNAVQFSSDGKAVVASTSTGVYQWDPASGKELQKPKEGTQAAFFMSAVSPDGKYLARFSWNVVAKVEVFDTKTQTELFPSDAYQVLSLAVSPNSKVLATGCSDKVIRLWDLNTAKELRKLEGHTGAVGFVFFTPDGKSLISAARDNSDRFITIWDLQNGKERKSIRGGNMLQALALSGDGHTLAYKYQDPQGMMSVCLMDLSGGKEIRKIQQVGFNQSVALSPDGKQCVYQDQKGETVITDVAEGKNTKTLLPGFSQGFVFAPDGSSVAVPGQDGLIHLIDAITGTDLRSIGEKPQGGGIFPPPPGGGIGGGKLGGIGIGGGGVANPGAIVRPPFFNQMLPVFSVDGRMVATNGPSGIALWEVATGKQRQIFSGAEQNINVMAFAPDGKTLVSSSVSGQVIFWDLAGLSKEEKAEADKLTAKEAEQLWQDLQGDDGAKAWHAIKVLRAAPKVSVTLLGDKLKPAEGADAKKIDKLIADLDAEGFDQRSKASAELEKLGEQAEAALRKAQKANPSAEAGKSIDELLQKLHGQGSLTGDKLRAARALEVLEQANSDDAAAVLKKLAAGADGWTTDAAKASLERIKAARE